MFEDANCELMTLTNFSTLIKVTAKKGYMKNEEIDMLTEWSGEPESWEK